MNWQHVFGSFFFFFLVDPKMTLCKTLKVTGVVTLFLQIKKEWGLKSVTCSFKCIKTYMCMLIYMCAYKHGHLHRCMHIYGYLNVYQLMSSCPLTFIGNSVFYMRLFPFYFLKIETACVLLKDEGWINIC